MSRPTTARLATASLATILLALPGCGAPPLPKPPVDFQLAQASRNARLAFDRGLTAEAASLYEQALNRAKVIDNPKEISDAAYNLAACLIELGGYARAEALLHEAQVEAGKAGLAAADILLLRARVAWLDGRAGDASDLAGQLLSLPVSAAGRSERCAALVLKGNVALARKDVAAARDDLRAADGQATTEPAALAGTAGLRAGIDLATGNVQSAAAGFDRQAALLQQAKLYPEMVAALARAGESYQRAGAAGDAAAAADRFFRAARSAAAQGDPAGARRYAASALQLAGQANEAFLAQQSQRLLESLP